MTDALAAFLRARFAEEVKDTRRTSNLMVTQAERLGLKLEDAEQQGRFRLAMAEARLTLLEDTVVPYLGTAGPGGRNAEYQLRLLAAPHMEHRDYPHDTDQPGSSE